MTRNNRAIGAKAKRAGDQFEALFFSAARLSGIAITRINDGCKTLGQNRMIRVKQPWDWVLTWDGCSALIDTKTTNGAAFPCSKIDNNQVRELARHAALGGVAGYVVWARTTHDLFFVPAGVLVAKALLPRGSIKPDEPGVISLGTAMHPRLTEMFNQQTVEVVYESH